MDTPSRRLACVLAADITGFSAIMERDEAATHSRVKAMVEGVVVAHLKASGGCLVKTTGDGFLATFASPTDAVRCSVAIQKTAAVHERDQIEPLRYRMGLHLGEVICDPDGDIFGEVVNIASRLEGIAPSGGIVVSGKVYDEVVGKIPYRISDQGLSSLKNISKAVRTYTVTGLLDIETDARPHQAAAISDPKPCLAVLPLSDFGSSESGDRFVDGLTEDLISELSRSGRLLVISRHSSFAFKGRAIDARVIAQQLGARYLVEGSARRLDNRLRVNIQLVDAERGDQIWAERFDREARDIFALQDEITAQVVDALVGRLTAVPHRRRTTSLSAYDLCVRGRALIGRSQEASQEAMVLFRRAIDADPSYAEAHRWLALNLWLNWAQWGEQQETIRTESLALARRAVDLDETDSGCRWILGHILAYDRHFEAADTEFRRALELNPNDADAWAMNADQSIFKGLPDQAIAQMERAFRLNPCPPSWYYWELGLAQYIGRRYRDAATTLRHDLTYGTVSRRVLAAALAQLGELDQARHEAMLFLATNAKFTIDGWIETQPFRDGETCLLIADGFRKAGLPA